ncbi:MAG: hypothetical protein RIR34_1152 [Actinomycetota bacterium]|jgi:two-component sensor histidine kinase
MFFAYILLSEIMRIAIFGLSLYSSLPDVAVDWAWILISRTVVYFGLAWLLKLINKKYLTPATNLISAALVSIFSLTADYYLYPDDSQIFKYGFVPTVAYMAALTVVAYAIYAPVVVDLRRYREGARALQEVEARTKASLEEIDFKTEVAEQIRRSQLEAIVIPQIQKLKDSLGTGATSATTSVERIKDLIETNIRPLSKDFINQRAQLRPVAITRPVASVLGAFFYRRPLTQGLRPIFWFFILSPVYLIGDVVVYGLKVFWVSMLANVVWALCLVGLSLIIPSRIRTSGFAAASFAGIAAYVLWLPIDRQIAAEMGNLNSVSVVSTASLANTFGLVFLMALAREISEALSDVLERKNTQSAELNLKIAEYNRKEWVLQRNWSYLLHGNIQAGLSVALIKLSQLGDSGGAKSAAAKRQIVREVDEILAGVIQTLQDPQVLDVDLYSSLQQQKDLWSGVSDIKFSLPERVEKAISDQSEIRFALNEMVCEAVVNAVKHGGAKRMTISFDIEDDGAILLKATNDGKAPSKDTVKSLGSRLFDDLAQRWSLTRHGKTTVLLAKLASTS